TYNCNSLRTVSSVCSASLTSNGNDLKHAFTCDGLTGSPALNRDASDAHASEPTPSFCGDCLDGNGCFAFTAGVFWAAGFAFFALDPRALLFPRFPNKDGRMLRKV